MWYAPRPPGCFTCLILVYAIREAATGILKQLAEKFGAEWAVKMVLPRVIELATDNVKQFAAPTFAQPMHWGVQMPTGFAFNSTVGVSRFRY